MTLRISVTLSITILCHFAEGQNAESRVLLIVMLNVVILTAVMLTVVMLNVVLLSVAMLSVVASIFVARAQNYKSFYCSKLRLLIISCCVCPWPRLMFAGRLQALPTNIRLG